MPGTDPGNMQPGNWHAPVQSGYGVHTVRVTKRKPGRIPGFDEITDNVLREWQHCERQAANRRVEQDLMDRYEIRIDLP